jgi:Na+-transporting methylmalonyl-CoA/oxaloacetate decarboxylase gamma subunit
MGIFLYKALLVMKENLITALIITVVGAGLVFGAIILLWLLMAILVKVSAEKKEIIQDEILKQPREELLKKVVAAAVAAAMMEESGYTPHEFPLPATALVSAWQAVMRTDILRKHGKSR